MRIRFCRFSRPTRTCCKRFHSACQPCLSLASIHPVPSPSSCPFLSHKRSRRALSLLAGPTFSLPSSLPFLSLSLSVALLLLLLLILSHTDHPSTLFQTQCSSFTTSYTLSIHRSSHDLCDDRNHPHRYVNERFTL